MKKLNFKTVLKRRDSEQSTEIKELEKLTANSELLNGGLYQMDQRSRRNTAEFIASPMKQAIKNNMNSNTNVIMKDTFQNDNHNDKSVLLIERFIDGLKFNEGITNMLKIVVIPISHKILNSKYINTESTGQLHLQSFSIGVLMTSIMIILQPFLMFYLDGWILFLGKIFKHLFGWLVVGGIISYVLNNKKEGQEKNKNNSPNQESRDNRFKQLQYTVKNSRSSSPKKKSRTQITKVNPYASSRSTDVIYDQHGPIEPTSDQMLIKMTEHAQVIEKARYDVDRSRIDENSNYEKFMDVAFKKDQEKGIYNKFVNDNREIINTKDILFGDD